MDHEPSMLYGPEGETIRFYFNACFGFIRDMVKHGKGNENEACEVFAETCLALNEAEQAGEIPAGRQDAALFIQLATENWLHRIQPTGDDG